MSRKTLLGLLAALCITQLAAVASMIVRYERTLRSGTSYRISVEPVDPADAFRGRYVAIRPRLIAPATSAMSHVARALLASWKQPVYVTLEAGTDGFAQVASVVEDEPAADQYLTAETEGASYEPATAETATPKLNGYNLRLPFDRYYMKETVAPEAERIYRESAANRAETRAWIVVRVRKGMGAVEGLYIDGKPIEAVVARSVGAPTTGTR